MFNVLEDEKSSSTGADEGDSVWEEVWLDATPGELNGIVSSSLHPLSGGDFFFSAV